MMHYRKKILARELRKNQTQTEAIVWELLRDRQFHNLKFRRQHVISGFIVDFYCHDLKLAIEIDGKIHETQKDYDLVRQERIERQGINVIRITNEEVHDDMEIVFRKIELFLR